MAGMLKHHAAQSVNKGHPSSFYVNENLNPVLQALEREIKQFQILVKKKNSPNYKPGKDEASSRAADTLFDLWNKYEPKLPRPLYQSKLLEVGDFLTTSGEYRMALHQCYTRYLQFFGNVSVDEISDINTFKQVFFADGFDGETAGFTFRALMGKVICSYELLRCTDPRLQNMQAFERCLQLLRFLRLVTQVILPQERLCWLVCNGTVHIYTISRHLMSLGHSAKVLEFLLWACMCMESSVPLLAVHYLGWRATLYAAVCQCYYDCKAGQHAEEFARRALSKINELSQLEAMCSHPESRATEQHFRCATVKMAVMVFKRAVFERRKVPKGLLRPKTRANLKDAASLPWPRTQTEKLLVDMLEGSGAQMLAIMEALSDSNRRTLLSAPPALDHEVEVLDVFAEMFMAAQEIVAGGGGAPAVITGKDSKGRGIAAEVTGPKFTDFKTPKMSGVLRNRALMDLAAAGEDGTPLSAVVRLVKHAYNYEQWDTFDALVEPALAVLKEVDDPKHAADEKALQLLVAYDRVVPRTKHRKLFQNNEDDDDDVTQPPPTAPPPTKKELQEPVRSQSSLEEDLMALTDVILSIVNGPFTTEEVELDMVVDATLMLWKRCKDVFSKYQTGSNDNPKYLQRMDSPAKWVYVLEGVQQAVGWCGISAVDPALAAEVVLRLALVFEASASLDEKKRTGESASPERRQGSQLSTSTAASGRDHQGTQHEGGGTQRDTGATSQTAQGGGGGTSPRQQQEGGSPGSPLGAERLADAPRASRLSMASTGALFGSSVREQLLQARDILEAGLENVSAARQAVALPDQKAIADVPWVKELHPELFSPLSVAEMESLTFRIPPAPGEEGASTEAQSVWNMVRDLHLELLYMYHRVCLKLVALGPDPKLEAKRLARSESELQQSTTPGRLGAFIAGFDELLGHCRRDNVSKALLHMQEALSAGVGGTLSLGQQEHLQTAKKLISRAEEEEQSLNVTNTRDVSGAVPYRVPPPPVLLCRTDRHMTFRPAPFTPDSGHKVAWYRIFARSAAGPNVKVRLNDYFLPGTGEQVPAFDCELRVDGLTPGDKYMFAVAAYTAEGALIGDSVGESTRPILASHAMPLLMAWAYLCQVSYQVGCLAVAREAAEVLWSHFVAEPPPPEHVIYVTSAQKDFRLTLHRLNQRVVNQASPVLLRMFLASIFIHVDIAVKERELFCDKLSDKGPLYKGQLERLRACERVLVIMQLAGWLNEPGLALQAVVQCYGLLAPLIHYKIPSQPVIQVLERCCVVLQEIPSHLRHKRTQSIAESLHHMTACLTYHMAKVLRSWGQRALASTINQAARELLALEPERERGIMDDTTTAGETTDTGSVTLATLKKMRGKRLVSLPSGKEDVPGTGNEELKALEAHMLRLSKQAQGEHELSGSEDPSILHAYIAYLPSRLAYKEVAKFKRRARYLEFLVQCAEKALTEGLAPAALEWCTETEMWIFKRNENLMGTRASIGKQPGAFTIIGDDPKKYQAAMVEYTKEREFAMSKKEKAKLGAKPPGAKPRKVKYKPIGWTPMMTDAQKAQQEDLELKALDLLAIYFADTYTSKMKRRKMRRIAADEMPWRSQLNTVMGLAQFGVFIVRLEAHERLTGGSDNYLYRTSFLDQEWFAFETANTLVVPGRGGGSDGIGGEEGCQEGGVSLALPKDPPTATGIELAAAAATGLPPAPLFPVPKDGADEDTLRTYRSDNALPATRRPAPATGGQQQGATTAGGKKKEKGRGGGAGGQQEDEVGPLSSEDAEELLNKTFTYLRRAVVLAHRGQHWILLQNACRTLWNTAHAALTRAISPDARRQGAPLLAPPAIRRLLWYAFYTAADCLMDMLVQMGRSDRRGKKEDAVPDVRSWTGTVADERGGAGLRFEAPLDDVSGPDMRWTRRVIMRTLQLLYDEKRWERLVDLALRFNALSGDRYAEFVNPLLLQAQRQLMQRIQEAGGQPAPQLHFQAAEKALGRAVTSRDYVTLQLTVQFEDSDTHSEIDPGARLDPEGHNAYSGLKSLKLVSVPLDVPQSLATLRASLTQASYTSRALQHARQMLVLYLAGRNELEEFGSPRPSHGPSHVDFVPTTARPHPTTPVDLSAEKFDEPNSVQTAALPSGQVTTVMQAYDKTIELLLARKQTGLAVEAMRELANLQYHTGHVRGAYRWWATALDTLLGAQDAVRTWRALLPGGDADASAWLLDRCGLWGCLLGATLCSNIAQYVLTSSLGLRTNCCFLAGHFFKALFRSSLPHPRSDRDYALYEVGEGCEVTNLVPGIDLLSDRFRADGRTLVAALHFVMEELARGRHNLFVLPLLSLYQFLTTFTCRDLQRSVDGRILKVRVLADLGLFGEAFTTLQRLLYGQRLPHVADSNFRHVEGRPPAHSFDASKPLLDPANLKTLESIVDKRVSPALGALYGPHLTCHLALAQAHLHITLADTVPALPLFTDPKPPGSAVVQPQPQVQGARGRGGGKNRPAPAMPQPSRPLVDTRRRSADETAAYSGSNPGASGAAGGGESMEPEGDSALSAAIRRFSAPDAKAPSLEVVKGALLATADSLLSSLSELVVQHAQYDKGVDRMAPAELELVVLCKLELASVARQRQHAGMAARVVLAAMRMLQRAEVFAEKQNTSRLAQMRRSQQQQQARGHSATRHPSPPRHAPPGAGGHYQYQDFASRSRLDARLWLHCRLALVRSLRAQITGLGQVKGGERSVLTDLYNIREYVAEGVAEAEACGDREMQAEFMLQAAGLDILQGRRVGDTKGLIQVVLELVNQLQSLSPSAQLLRTQALVQLADLEAAASEGGLQLEASKSSYLRAHAALLNQLQELGQPIQRRYDGQHEYATPQSPLTNLYLPQLQLLVQVKLRVGHAMARLACSLQKDVILSDAASEWARPLGVLNTALELSKVIAARADSVQAEIYLVMGKVQRQLYQLGQCHQRACALSLTEAIKTSYTADHDLGLMRQAYLELAVVYLLSSGQGLAPLKEAGTLESLSGPARHDSTDDEAPPNKPDDETSVTSGRDSSRRGKKWKNKKERSEAKERRANPPGWEQERRAAWLAVRCAALTGAAMRGRLLLVGDPTVSSASLPPAALTQLPDYIALDLLAPYVLGQRKKLYKSEIEEELAPLTEQLEPPPVETYEDEVKRVRDAAAADVSWTHVIGYQAILQRLMSTTNLASPARLQSDSGEELGEGAGQLGPEFDLGFVSHAQCDLAVNNDVVRTTADFCGWELRVCHLHHFLAAQLKTYSEECCGVYPPKQLQLPLPKEARPVAEVELITYSYRANALTPVDVQPPVTPAAQSGAPTPTPAQPTPTSAEALAEASGRALATVGENELAVQWYLPALDEFNASSKSWDSLTEQTGADKRVLLLFANVRKKLGAAELPQSAMLWVSHSQLLDLHDRLTVLVSRGELSLPQGTDHSRHVDPKVKKRSTRIKALSPRFKKDEPLESLLRQCMKDSMSVLRYSPPSEEEAVEEEPAAAKPAGRKQKKAEEQPEDPDQFPFDVTRTTMHNLEKLFDPSFGHTLRDPKVLKWALPFFEQQL